MFVYVALHINLYNSDFLCYTYFITVLVYNFEQKHIFILQLGQNNYIIKIVFIKFLKRALKTMALKNNALL